MRVLAIVHQRDAGAGVFAEETRERGVEFDEWLIAEQPEPPADPAGYDAVMIFGGAMNTHEEEMHPWIRREKDLLAELLDRGTPLLRRVPRHPAAGGRGGRGGASDRASRRSAGTRSRSARTG